MKVLVTGARGQVGQALLASVPQGIEAAGVAHAQLDIADAAAVHRLVGAQAPEVIINAAAYTAVDKAESDAQAAQRVNAEGPRNLAAAARETGARLLHLSTDFVFDGHASRPYVPGAPAHPLGVYGRTKRAGEEAVLAGGAAEPGVPAVSEASAARQGVPAAGPAPLVLRTAWVYGPAGGNFLKTMLRVMAASGRVRVVADQVGTPTSTASLAQALWAIVARPQLSGIHHWTDGGVASWYDFAVAIAEEAAAVGLLPPGIMVEPITTEEYPTPARRPAYSVLDKRSLCQALQFQPPHWRVSLRSVLAGMPRAQV